MTGFEMTLDDAALFFEVCHRLNLNTETERLAVLRVMAAKGHVKRAFTTKRTKEQYIKDISKHMSVLSITKNKEAAHE